MSFLPDVIIDRDGISVPVSLGKIGVALFMEIESIASLPPQPVTAQRVSCDMSHTYGRSSGVCSINSTQVMVAASV